MGFLWLLLARGIARILISRLYSQILMQTAMDNVPASSCRTDLADLGDTTLSSAQLLSPPLPTALLCVCERPMLLAQDKRKETSSGREQTWHKSSWEQRAILMGNLMRTFLPSLGSWDCSGFLSGAYIQVSYIIPWGSQEHLRDERYFSGRFSIEKQMLLSGTGLPLSLQTTIGYVFLMCTVVFLLLLVHPISCQMSYFPLV